MKKIFILLFVLLFSTLGVYAESYPKEMLREFDKEYLDYYFSLPPNERTDDQINQWGKYDSANCDDCYYHYAMPNSTIYPLVPKEVQEEAERRSNMFQTMAESYAYNDKVMGKRSYYTKKVYGY